MDNQTVSGVYLAYIDAYLRQLGEDSRAVFRGAGIDDPAAIHPAERVSMRTFWLLLRSIRRLVKRPAFFFELGAYIPVMAHGSVGSAMLTCDDVRAVLKIAADYATIVIPSVRFMLRESPEGAVFEYGVSAWWQDVGVALLEGLIGMTTHNLSVLAGQPVYPTKVCVDYPPPPHAEVYRRCTRCPVEFGAEHTRLVFSSAQLALPIRTADKVSQRFMVERCEDELHRLRSETPLIQRVRELALLHLDSSPSIGFVAEKLGMSERTLRRRLQEEGVLFRDLLKQVRHETAQEYLATTDLAIETIALRLGYKETANFRKAFKGQATQSPRQWRKERR